MSLFIALYNEWRITINKSKYFQGLGYHKFMEFKINKKLFMEAMKKDFLIKKLFFFKLLKEPNYVILQ